MIGALRSWSILAKAAVVGGVSAGVFAAIAGHLVGPSHRVFQSLDSDKPVQLSAFADERGAETSIDAFRGKIVILNLWAAWCVPCLREMPALDRLAERLPDDKYAVIAVNVDRGSPEVAKRSFARLGLSRLRLYVDSAGKLSSEIGARGMPTTLILGTNGKPLSFREGAAEWDSDDVVADMIALQQRAQE